MNLCTIKMPQRKPQNYLVQLAEASAGKVVLTKRRPQVAPMENLAEGQKLLPLTKGGFTIVDSFNFEKLNKYKWHSVANRKNAKNYARRSLSIKRKEESITMHRFLLNLKDSKIHVDHINGNGLDNRMENLRIVSNAENQRAKRSKPIKCSSHYRGVSWHKPSNKWIAKICFNYKKIYIGLFESEIKAAQAWDENAIKLGFLKE